MVFLIVQKWHNTERNHAGMYHLSKLLSNKHPNVYKLISISDFKINRFGLFFRFYNLLFANMLLHINYVGATIYLLIRLKENDRVILFEYLTPGIRQDYIPRFLNLFLGNKCKIFGFVHLVPSILSNQFSRKKIQERLNMLSGIFTFGTSLSFFLADFTNIKITTLHHYSDLNYYRPSNSISLLGKLNVLIIGQQSRDYTKLFEIVSSFINIDFHIVVNDIDSLGKISHCTNVKTYKMIDESKLLELMERCHCSLGFYNDVVGSNVLSNCISMGIVTVVKDIGSIRNYLSENDSYLCKSFDEFKTKLSFIDKNRKDLIEKRSALIKKSNFLDFDSFHEKLQISISS